MTAHMPMPLASEPLPRARRVTSQTTTSVETIIEVVTKAPMAFT